MLQPLAFFSACVGALHGPLCAISWLALLRIPVVRQLLHVVHEGVQLALTVYLGLVAKREPVELLVVAQTLITLGAPPATCLAAFELHGNVATDVVFLGVAVESLPRQANGALGLAVELEILRGVER